MLTRSGLVNRNRNIKEVVKTPSEDATPKTLIGGILEAASVSKSAFISHHTRKSKLTKSASTGPPVKRNRPMRQSLGDNATPRTMITNFLMEASPETPLEVPLYPAEEKLPDEEDDTGNRTLPYSMQDPVLSSVSEMTNKEEIIDDAVKNLPIMGSKSQMEIPGDLEESNEISVQGDLENNEKEDAENQSPAPVNAGSPIFSSQVDETSTNTSPEESHGFDSIQEKYTDAPLAEASSEAPEKSRWRDLVTPHLPIRKKNILSEKQQVEVEEENERATKAVKKPPLANKRTKMKSTPDDTNLPQSLIKSIFQHFSKSRISKNTLRSIEKGSSVFFKQISSDLMAYSKHAGRSTIEIHDVELLMKRQGFITDKQSLNSLIEKYLPLEYRQELIPVVQSGNKVVLKKST